MTDLIRFDNESTSELVRRIREQCQTKYGNGFRRKWHGHSIGYRLECLYCGATEQEGHGEHCVVRLMLAAASRLEYR